MFFSLLILYLYYVYTKWSAWCILDIYSRNIRNGFLLSYLIFIPASKKKSRCNSDVSFGILKYNKKKPNICYNKTNKKNPTTFIINDRKVNTDRYGINYRICQVWFLVMKSNTLLKYNTLNLYAIKKIYIHLRDSRFNEYFDGKLASVFFWLLLL